MGIVTLKIHLTHLSPLISSLTLGLFPLLCSGHTSQAFSDQVGFGSQVSTFFSKLLMVFVAFARPKMLCCCSQHPSYSTWIWGVWKCTRSSTHTVPAACRRRAFTSQQWSQYWDRPKSPQLLPYHISRQNYLLPLRQSLGQGNRLCLKKK